MKDILKPLGFLDSESSVYSALIESGELTAGKIAKMTLLNRVSVYKALDSLILEGLVSYKIINGKKTFNAANPKKIKQIIEDRKKELVDAEKKIPLYLEKIRKNISFETDIYEGIPGLKTVADIFLDSAKKGDEWLVLGAPKKAEILGGFYKGLNDKRAKKKVVLKIVYNKDASSLFEVRKRQPLSKVRIMLDNYITPTSIEILGDNLAIILYSPITMTYYIKNKGVAESFRNYFDIIWKNSIKA